MKNSEFNPVVRYFEKVSWNVSYDSFVYAYDYRLFFVALGNLEVELTDKNETLSEGDAIIIPPGTAYRLKCDDYGFSYYIADFDFTHENGKTKPKSPDFKEAFDKDGIFSVKAMAPFSEVFLQRGCNSLLPFLQEMLFARENSNEEFCMIKSGLLKYILTKIKLLSEKEVLSDEALKLMKNIKALVSSEWNKGINNEKIAKTLGYHPYYLNTVFIKAEGKTLHKYIEDVKIKRAGEKLVLSDKSIASVAEECGFPDASSFSAFFRKKEGVSPKKYRENFYTGCR